MRDLETMSDIVSQKQLEKVSKALVRVTKNLLEWQGNLKVKQIILFFFLIRTKTNFIKVRT